MIICKPGRLYIGRCNGYWSADRCVMQRNGDESVVVAIATLFNNKMAGTLEQEAFEKNIDENEQKNPLPYNSLADFSTILSGINKNLCSKRLTKFTNQSRMSKL